MPEESLKNKTVKGVGGSDGSEQLPIVSSFESTFDMGNVKDLMLTIGDSGFGYLCNLHHPRPPQAKSRGGAAVQVVGWEAIKGINLKIKE